MRSFLTRTRYAEIEAALPNADDFTHNVWADDSLTLDDRAVLLFLDASRDPQTGQSTMTRTQLAALGVVPHDSDAVDFLLGCGRLERTLDDILHPLTLPVED